VDLDQHLLFTVVCAINSLMPPKRSIHDTGDIRPTNRRRLTMSLETESNDLSDADHTRLDKLVLNIVNTYYAPPFLLATIVEKSEGKLNPKYKANGTASALLNEHPDLRGELDIAWEAKSFKNIRNLSESSSLLLRTMAYKLPWISRNSPPSPSAIISSSSIVK
jgi:hypothetical protein